MCFNRVSTGPKDSSGRKLDELGMVRKWRRLSEVSYLGRMMCNAKVQTDTTKTTIYECECS